jgi:hypothetical protein
LKGFDVMHKCKAPALVVVLWLSGFTAGIAGEYENAQLGIVVKTDDDWSTADEATTKLLTQMTSQSAVVHARAKDADASSETVDSAVLLLYSKLPLGAAADNPNLILAKEKAWSDEFEKSGAGYLKLLEQRVTLLGAPTKFEGKPRVVKIGDAEFHQSDAVNTKIPEAPTKQRYFCTFKNGYYVFFVLSLNDELDADYSKMMKVVESFRSSNNDLG